MNEQMEFPETFEEFAKEYGFKDKDDVYTNGSDLIQIFRVKQWLEHDNKLRRIETDTAYECGKHANKALDQEPSSDMVSRGVFEQIMWERDVAIEQLKELGYELGQKVEPCEDCISRQATIDGINRYFHDEYYQRTSIQDCRDCLIEDVIKPLPPVNPQPKTGRWIEERTYMECPNCHDVWHYEENQTERFKCCPTCGERIK